MNRIWENFRHDPRNHFGCKLIIKAGPRNIKLGSKHALSNKIIIDLFNPEERQRAGIKGGTL